MAAHADAGARVMFWMWMSVVVGGFTAMILVLLSGR